ncbi:P-loop containing nucleoside triphosphate hydrolase protein [Scleroderma yunnanense]
MAPKRKRADEEGEEDSDSAFSIVRPDDDVDISSALTVHRAQKATVDGSDNGGDGTDDDELGDFINDSIARRNIKGGTDLLKKIKSKGKGKGDVGGGSFQSMGLHPPLLRALTMQGYRTPTPIQRATIPSLLALPPKDLVGMARTGSGKTLAYMIPLLQRLGGRHSHAFGARAIILVPARELALQVLRVGKSLVKGWRGDSGRHVGDGHEDDDGISVGKGETLRWGLIVGGEGMDEQFEMISNNPDVIIATPGRLLHLIVEMNLSLAATQYVVFDEADRLFELGFSTALTEILARLPASRQTLLFSATLPKSLVEFAKAGLRNPKLVRLDAESKLSADLRMAFFSVKQAEKDACLLSLLRDVIQVPLGNHQGTVDRSDERKHDKGKRKAKPQRSTHTAPHQTLVFVATKHHVEYLSALLTSAGYAVSALYGSLVQSTRTYQMSQFLAQKTQILVVTDVAARGLDIPVLEHVVNYDFPVGARVFIHRVGRTARAGRRGWAWSFVTHSEAAYLCDLQLFLGRPLVNSASHLPTHSTETYTQSLILGPFSRDVIDTEIEHIRSLDITHGNLPSLRGVMERGQSMYERSRGKASVASYRRAKEMAKNGGGWASDAHGVHPVLALMQHTEESSTGNELNDEWDREAKRREIVRVVSSFKPAETIFEMGTRGKASAGTAALMKERRKALAKAVERAPSSLVTENLAVPSENEAPLENSMLDVQMADEEDIAAVFGTSSQKKGKTSFRDEDFFMSHYRQDAHTEKGYSLTDGASSFATQAQGASFDLAGDVTVSGRQRHKLSWDKKKKNFVKGDGVGADNVKLVRTENGTRLPATYRSGRFDEWQKKARVTMPKIGEQELSGTQGVRGIGGKKWRHSKVSEAKPLDKLHKDYDRKARQLKKEQEATAGASDISHTTKERSNKKAQKTGGRRVGKSIRRHKTELKTVEQIHKGRRMAERRKTKNARPNRKSKR